MMKNVVHKHWWQQHLCVVLSAATFQWLTFWRFSTLGPSTHPGMDPTPRLITRPPLSPLPSLSPILFELHQSKSSSRIANASDCSTRPNNPEVEEFFAAG